jgi:hypothetical protein
MELSVIAAASPLPLTPSPVMLPSPSTSPCIHHSCYRPSTQISITCQSNPLHCTQSANTPRQKKNTYRPLQQMSHKAKEDNLPHKQHDPCYCVSQTREVGTAECNTKLFSEVHQTCICAREHQLHQKSKKVGCTWQPSLLQRRVLTLKGQSLLQRGWGAPMRMREPQ